MHCASDKSVVAVGTTEIMPLKETFLGHFVPVIVDNEIVFELWIQIIYNMSLIFPATMFVFDSIVFNSAHSSAAGNIIAARCEVEQRV